jgi:predicted DNA-binding transcriptional regulator YafY
MLATSTRLLSLLGLLQARRDWPGPALAERLEVDPRTVRRDIDRLRELGYRIDASAGLGGGYRLGPGPTLPPVLLTDDEALTVMLALRAAAGSVAGLDAASEGLRAKLDHLLPPRLRSRLRGLDAVTSILPGGPDLAQIEALARIAAACRDRRRLHMAYRDRDGRDSERQVEPMQLVNTGRRWYLLAWDLARADWRTFRVDRIGAIGGDGEAFEPRPLPDEPARMVAQALGRAPAPFQLRVRLRGSHAALSAQVPCWCGLLEPLDEASCQLHVGGDSVETVAALLLMTGQPPELLDAPSWLPQLSAAVARLASALPRAGKEKREKRGRG